MVFKNATHTHPCFRIACEGMGTTLLNKVDALYSYHEEENGNMHSVVFLGITTNLLMVVACFTTLAWIRSKSNNDNESSSDIHHAPIQIQPTADAKAQCSSSSRSIPPIFASRDLDTQNMLLASANVNIFFNCQTSSCQKEPLLLV